MKLHRIIEDIDASKAIIERWTDADSMPTIEKDILLTNLQNIYREVLALPSQVVANVTSIPSGTVEFIIEPEQHSEPIVEEQVVDVVVEPTTEPEPELMDYPEPIIEEKPEPVPEFRVIFGQRVPNELIDKFIMELFWRDEQFFVNEVSKLAAQPTLDAVLFYICEKYNWNAQSETAEKFTELLANYQFEQ